MQQSVHSFFVPATRNLAVYQTNAQATIIYRATRSISTEHPSQMSEHPGSFFEVLSHFRLWRPKGSSHTAALGNPYSSPGKLSRSGSFGIGGGKGGAEAEAQAALHFQNFLHLCLSFGLGQGAVITTVTYSTTFLGNKEGSYTDGFFFGAFTLTSFCLADIVTSEIGLYRSYRVALALFLIYEIVLFVAFQVTCRSIDPIHNNSNYWHRL